MGNFRTSRTFDAVFLVGLGGLLVCSYIFRSSLGDYIFFVRYQPSAEVIQLADAAGLSDYGRHIFYRGDPQIMASQSTLAAACEAEDLGCINAKGQLFILDTPDHHAGAVVTATHEMLHLAYRRLSKAQRAEVDAMTTRALVQLSDKDLSTELEAYPVAERPDEAHSIIGSEVKATPELEDYYKQYFSDRGKVLAAEHDAERE